MTESYAAVGRYADIFQPFVWHNSWINELHRFEICTIHETRRHAWRDPTRAIRDPYQYAPIMQKAYVWKRKDNRPFTQDDVTLLVNDTF